MSEYADETDQALQVLGGLLKHWRGLRGMSQRELAERIPCSCDFLASIEQGRRRPREPFFDLAYFDAMAIPAVMRTEAYARATLAGFAPVLDDDGLDALIADQLARRAVLDRTPRPARLAFVIDESVLRRPVGGWAVFADQLRRVAEIARRRNVTVQVLPLDCEDHAGLSGSALLMEAVERVQVAYVEHAGGGQWIVSPKDVSLLQQRYGTLRAQAMTTRDSLDLIEKLAAGGHG